MGYKIINNSNIKQSTNIKLVVVLTIAQFQTLIAQTFDDNVQDASLSTKDQWWISLIVVAAFVYIINKTKAQIKGNK
jgi:hypothetical protein